jgi:hypothetical protein
MEENEPTINNIENRVRQLMLGINAMVSLTEFLNKGEGKGDAFEELLQALDLDLEARFIEEFTQAGMIGEA